MAAWFNHLNARLANKVASGIGTTIDAIAAGDPVETIDEAHGGRSNLILEGEVLEASEQKWCARMWWTGDQYVTFSFKVGNCLIDLPGDHVHVVGRPQGGKGGTHISIGPAPSIDLANDNTIEILRALAEQPDDARLESGRGNVA